MVGPRRNQSLSESRRLSISEWNGAHIEEITSEEHATCTDDGCDDISPATPEMNLGTVYNSIRPNCNSSNNDSGRAIVDAASPREVDHTNVNFKQAQSSHDVVTSGGTRADRRKSSALLSCRKSSTLFRRSTITIEGDGGSTIAPSSSASRTSYSSSAGTNIWSKLLGGGNESLWDGIDGKKDAYDDMDEYKDHDSLDNGIEGYKDDHLKTCKTNVRRLGLSWWYETRHFLRTVMKYPHIWISSLLVFGIIVGVGMAAINAEKEVYIAKQKGTAQFVASETAQWFSNEFRRAMLPLYSVQQGVIHSGYFNDLPQKIGAYPKRVIPESEETPFTKRNVSGICDDPLMVQYWKDIVEPINTDNDLDGIVQGYRLFPANVACLTTPHEDVGIPADTEDKFDGMFDGEALLASDNVVGLDTGHTDFPLWKMITTDLFINKQFNIFGPFSMPPMTELICGHLAIWTKPDPSDPNILDVHGTDVDNAWGFVVNFLDWKKLKDKSNIYERFSGCNLEFRLSRKSGSTVGLDSEVLAESPGIDNIDDANTISVETETMHGIWVNKVGSKNNSFSPPWYPAAVAGVVIGSLIIAFLTASTLVERQLHCNLVNKMLPKRAIVKLHRGQTVLEKYNLVTIFFSDIVGFTSMAGSMRPIQVMKMLNELYTEMDKLVEKHQVYKVETIGDAYMVVGGAPNRVPAPLAAERVAMFAIDATEFVRNFRTKDGDRVFIRAGLASGPVVAGVVGQAMPRYCFFGDTVNFASRMESTSKQMKVQVAEITYRLLLDAPNINFTMSKRMDGDIAGVMIKGKGHQITYWAEAAALRSANDTKVVKVVDSPTYPQPSISLSLEASSDIETPGYLPKLSETIESPFSKLDASGSSAGSAGYADFLKLLSATSDRREMSMYTSEEIYQAMSNQEWEKLGYAESVLVEATNDHAKMIVRASALLEHRLDRVLKHRDASAQISTDVRLQISEFVGEVASTYTDDAKFHNLAHALHVTTSMNKLLSQTVVEDPLNSFTLVFSAIIHDAGHTGMSNKILSDTSHPLSIKYQKDVPIAEKYSIDIGLNIFFRDEFKELRHAILPDVYDKILYTRTLFQAILCTDIASSDNVKLRIERFALAQHERGEYELRICPLVPYLDNMFDIFGLEDSDKEEFSNEFKITHTNLQKCVRNEHLMLIADVSHLVQDWNNFVKWNFRLFQEIKNCSRKGFCDDPLHGWSMGQIAFLDHYILPLAKRSKIFFYKEFGDNLVENGMTNLKLWKQHGDKATSIMSTAVELGEDESDVLLRLYELPECAMK